MKQISIFSEKLGQKVAVTSIGGSVALRSSSVLFQADSWTNGGWSNTYDNWTNSGWTNGYGGSWTNSGWSNTYDSWTNSGWTNGYGGNWSNSGWSNSGGK